MEPDASVGRGDHVLVVCPPGRDDAVDRFRRELRAIGEHDHGRLGLARERTQAAAKRGAWAALPLGTENRPRGGLDFVRAEHDDHIVDAAPADAFKNRLE